MGTLSPNLGLQIPTIGGDLAPLFSQEINGSLTTIDSVCGGVNSLNVGGSANITLNSSQAQNLVQQFTGTLTGNITVFAPATGRFYAVENATTGNFSLAFGCTGGGNTQIIPQGLSTWVWTDGSLTRLSNPPGWQELATYTASAVASLAPITLPGPFRRYRLTLQNITVAATGGGLLLQGSNNGGASFTGGGTGYQIVSTFTNSGTTINTSLASQATIPLTAALNTAATSWDGVYEIWPGSSTRGMVLRGGGCGVTNAPFFGMLTLSATSTVVNANAIALICNGNTTFSGTVIVEGLP